MLDVLKKISTLVLKELKNKKYSRHIVKTYTSPELKVTSKLFKSRNRSAALLINDITSTPKRAMKIRIVLQSNNMSLYK